MQIQFHHGSYRHPSELRQICSIHNQEKAKKKTVENSLVGLGGSLASFLWQLLAKDLLYPSSPRNQSRLRMSQTYQLIHIPSANTHVTLVVIHALAEVADIGLTGGVLPGAVGCAALPQSVVHGLGVGRSGLLRLSGSIGPSAKKTTDSMSDGGTDCDTTVEEGIR